MILCSSYYTPEITVITEYNDCLSAAMLFKGLGHLKIVHKSLRISIFYLKLGEVVHIHWIKFHGNL